MTAQCILLSCSLLGYKCTIYTHQSALRCKSRSLYKIESFRFILSMNGHIYDFLKNLYFKKKENYYFCVKFLWICVFERLDLSLQLEISRLLFQLSIFKVCSFRSWLLPFLFFSTSILYYHRQFLLCVNVIWIHSRNKRKPL